MTTITEEIPDDVDVEQLGETAFAVTCQESGITMSAPDVEEAIHALRMRQLLGAEFESWVTDITKQFDEDTIVFNDESQETRVAVHAGKGAVGFGMSEDAAQKAAWYRATVRKEYEFSVTH